MGFLKIDGMASVPSAENNSPKDIIEEVNRPRSRNVICELAHLDALNEYSVSCNNYYGCNGGYYECSHKHHFECYERVPMITLEELYYNPQTISFVFNIEDVRKKPLLAFFMMLNRKKTLNQPSLPLEVLKTNVLSCFVTIEKDDGTFDFKQSPNYLKSVFDYRLLALEDPIISTDQVKKLYELGAIKLVTLYYNDDEDDDEDEDEDEEDTYLRIRSRENHMYSYRILSDESFDADTAGVLKAQFQTKEKMHEHIQKVIQKFF